LLARLIQLKHYPARDSIGAISVASTRDPKNDISPRILTKADPLWVSDGLAGEIDEDLVILRMGWPRAEKSKHGQRSDHDARRPQGRSQPVIYVRHW
jgi:hypothetical protein